MRGPFTTVQGTSRNRVARLHASGTVDAAFDPGAGVSGASYALEISAIAAQADGKVMIGGDFYGLVECFGREARQPDDTLMQVVQSVSPHIGQFIARKQAEAARQAAAARESALAAWRARIGAKIRSNIPETALEGIPGNPAAVFDVVQLPTGEVLTVRMRKSSGYRRYDEAVERAILKSSPLPPPPARELFQRELELTFRPQDK